MKLIKCLLFILFFPFLYTSCEVKDLENKGDSLNKNERSFTLSYKVSSPTSFLTKSTIELEEGENKINSFYILFFENTSGRTGMFVEALDVMADYNVPLYTSGSLEIIFPEGSSLDASMNYNLLVCVNIEAYSNINNLDDLITYCTNLTEDEVTQTLLEISGVDSTGLTPEEEQVINDNYMPIDNLPMSASLIKKAGEREVAVELNRVVSRFDVISMAEGFELVSASIWNAYEKTTIWKSIFSDYLGARTERYYGVDVNDNKVIGSLYAFENYVSGSTQIDDKTTCLILGFRRGTGLLTEYFRVNMNVEGYGQQLRRDNVYQITIVGIEGLGSPTERDAYENPENKIRFLSISPYQDWTFLAGGGSTDIITVTSNGEWKAEVVMGSNGNAFFQDPTEEEDEQSSDDDGDDDEEPSGETYFTGSNGDSFILTCGILNNLSTETTGTVRVYLLSDPDTKVEFNIVQKAISSEDLVVHTSHRDIGSLYHISNYRGHRYVYNLATNMRNTNLFGPNSLEAPLLTGYVFIYGTGSSRRPNNIASIYQLSMNPASETYLGYAKTWHENKSNRFLWLSNPSNLQTGMQRYEKVFLGRSNSELKYTVNTTLIDAEIDRTFNSGISVGSHPLVNYLLDGPFGQIDPEAIVLKGRRGTATRSLSSWPETFVPLIMAKVGDQDYCVFGIDPTNRFIFLGDVAIFGSRNNSNANYNYTNYDGDHPENQKFLNNFIGWLSYAVAQDGFLETYQTPVVD